MGTVAGMARKVVCAETELSPGRWLIVDIDGRSIGVLSVAGRLYAIRNRCPHQGAELCAGTVGGTMVPSGPLDYEYGLEGQVLRCPWHGWEFDMETGKSVFDPDNVRVRTYPVTVEDGSIVIEISGRGRSTP